DNSWQGPIARHLGADEKRRAVETAGLRNGDTLLMVAGPRAKVRPILGELRLQLGSKFGLIKTGPPGPGDLKFLWIVDFPLFEYSEEQRRLVSVNHPFTAPHPRDL